jgi:hypothetical protein
MLKIIGLIACLTVSGLSYAACKTVIIDSPKGSQVCFVCNDGKYINCSPL